MSDLSNSADAGASAHPLAGRHRVGTTVYDADTGFLLRDGDEITLRAKSRAVLTELLARRGQVVSKADLLDAVWPGTHVTEDSLVQCIADIRRALGDDAADLETHSKRGYRLLKATGMAANARPRIAALVVAAALLIAAIWAFVPLGSRNAPPPFDGRIAVLVLPFEDSSVGPDTGYLGNAIAEGVIGELASFGELAVISANTAAALDADEATIAELADATHADFVLRGSQRKQGDTLRVNVQLAAVDEGDTVWTETYDRPIGNFFAMQSALVRSVASAVGQELAYEVEPSSDPNRVSALLFHIRGRNAFQEGFDANINAEFARWNFRAIEADPSASWGWSGLGWYYRNAAQFGWNDIERDDALALAIENADRGLALGPEDYYAHFVRAGIHVTAGDMSTANRMYDRAIALNPSASNAIVLSTSPLLYEGRTQEAIARVESAIEIDPFHPPWYNWQLAWAYWQDGDCAAAEEAINRISVLSPQAHGTLAVILHCLDRSEEGQQALAVYAAQRADFTLDGERARLEATWEVEEALERWIAALRALGAPG